MDASSRSLFQALLLATALGWNGVFAQHEYGNGTNATSPTLYAPVVGVSQPSLIVPATTTTTSIGHPIPLTPIVAHSRSSLDVPHDPASSSSRAVVAPNPVTQHTEVSFDKPTSRPSHQTSQRRPAIEHSHDSLEVPTTSEPPTAYPSPVTGHTFDSLEVPTHSGTLITYHSPVTGHSETALQVPDDKPSRTAVAPIVATAKSQSKLIVPTRRPDDISPLGHGEQQPTQAPTHNQQNAGQPTEVNIGGVIASIAHEHGHHESDEEHPSSQPMQTTGQGSPDHDHSQNAADEGRPDHQGQEEAAQGSTYHMMGTQIVAGASAATIDGTTYSLAPSADGIYINGHQTIFTGPAATDSVAMALMSAIGGDSAAESISQNSGGSTMATATSGREIRESSAQATRKTTPNAASSAGESGAASGTVTEQTGNAGALVLPGLGLGVLGLLPALL